MANVNKLISFKMDCAKSRTHPYKRDNRNSNKERGDVDIQLDKLLLRVHSDNGYHEVIFSKDEILAIGREALADVPVSFY